jgi:hypothetical protein
MPDNQVLLKAGSFMYRLLYALPASLLAVFAVVGIMPAAYAQAPPAVTSPGVAPKQAQPEPNNSENNAMLAKAARLYYSTSKEGLSGFNCAVHPDWHALFVSAQPGSAISPADERIVLLNSVKITLHAHMNGSSTLDWEPVQDPNKPADQDSTNLLKNMHQATEQNLQGVLPFWTVLVDGSAIPDSSEGLEIAPTSSGYKIHFKQGANEVTETLGGSLLLEHFDVNLNGSSIKLVPSYQSTEKGLLVTGFQAQLLAQGAPAEKTQEMRVGIEYKTIEGFPIPSQLNMQVIGTGVFNFSFDGCAVSKQAN